MDRIESLPRWKRTGRDGFVAFKRKKKREKKGEVKKKKQEKSSRSKQPLSRGKQGEGRIRRRMTLRIFEDD